jgi:hypothetical protein
MKNIIILLMLAVLSVTVNAQIVPTTSELQSLTPKNRNAAYTLLTTPDTTATGSADTTYQVWEFSNATDFIVKGVTTKTGGTLAGHEVVRGSPDGVTWFTLLSSTADALAASFTEDTASIGNATETNWWYIKNHIFKYYQRRLITSDGAATLSGTIFYRKNEH